MSIEAADLKLYKSAVINNGSTNGGRMSTTAEIVSGVMNNMFPNVTQAERTAGLTRYRKGFSKVYDDGTETLYNHKVWCTVQTPANDLIQVRPATNTDTQSDAEGYSTGWLGNGRLATVVAVDATEIEVDFEDASGIANGDDGWLSDGTNEEFVEVTNVSWSVNQATITLASGLSYGYSTYATSGTVFAGYHEYGDTTASQDNVAVTSASGTFDPTYLLVYNKGCVEDSWTISFTGSSTFTCSGTNTGSISGGSTASDYEPTNPNVSGAGNYYFRVTTTAWGGSWINGNTVTFDTHHAARAFWVKEIVPAGTASYSNNNPEIRVSGESA